MILLFGNELGNQVEVEDDFSEKVASIVLCKRLSVV